MPSPPGKNSTNVYTRQRAKGLSYVVTDRHAVDCRRRRTSSSTQSSLPPPSSLQLHYSDHVYAISAASRSAAAGRRAAAAAAATHLQIAGSGPDRCAGERGWQTSGGGTSTSSDSRVSRTISESSSARSLLLSPLADGNAAALRGGYNCDSTKRRLRYDRPTPYVATGLPHCSLK